MPRDARRLAPPFVAVFCILVVWLLPVHAAPQRTIATFSIVAHDPATGELGVAVQSRFFAVGAAVPFAEGDVGASRVKQWATRPSARADSRSCARGAPCRRRSTCC